MSISEIDFKPIFAKYCIGVGLLPIDSTRLVPPVLLIKTDGRKVVIHNKQPERIETCRFCRSFCVFQHQTADSPAFFSRPDPEASEVQRPTI